MTTGKLLGVTLSPDLASRVKDPLARAVRLSFASRLRAGDHTLWGKKAETEAAIRLGWTASPADQQELVSEILALKQELYASGVSSFVLCGMGGSSLAPEVMAAYAGVPLSIVDSTHPAVVGAAVSQNLSETALIVSSKSGGTVETDSQRRAFEQAFQDQGIDPATRIIVVTDPGSPLEKEATERGYRVFLGNPSVGGRFSALSAFGLVPSGLAGVDISQVLDEASAVWEAMGLDSETNPGLILGAALAVGHPMVATVLLRSFPLLPGLGNWIEQLVAESTGKDGKGLLPVVDSVLSGALDCLSVGPGSSGADIQIEGGLGAHFLLWQYATAFAGEIIGVNPFDQPNVESAKIAARKALEGGGSSEAGDQDLVPGGMVSSSLKPGTPLESLEDAARYALTLVGEDSYLALCVFGDSRDSTPWNRVREHLEVAMSRPVTLGFGPRFLHSTGQFHKGGPARGVFLQILEKSTVSVRIPGREFDFSQLMEAQARGDRDVLIHSNQPTITLSVESAEARARVLDALLG